MKKSVVDYLALEEFEQVCSDDALERLLLGDSPYEDDDEEYLTRLDANSQGLKSRAQFDSLQLSSREFRAPKPSIEKPPK